MLPKTHNNYSPLDLALYPEAQKFMNWYNAEKAKGLKDVKFFPWNISESTSEEFFREANEILAAPDVEDPRNL